MTTQKLHEIYKNAKTTCFNNKVLTENVLVFIFCFAVIFGAAFALFDTYNYDVVANPDIKTYLGLANFDFDQSPIRKYRVIVPFIASGVNFILSPVFVLLKPQSFPGPDFSLCMSFLIVNTSLMSIFGTIIFRLCKSYGVTTVSAIVGVLSVLTCRWTSYMAGIPLVDSLYLVIIALTLLGIKTKQNTLITIAIFVGPWAKESFIFIAPLIFFYANINRYKQLLLFAFSFLIVFSFRYYYDISNQILVNESLSKDIAHVGQIIISLKRLFSFHGIYEMFSIVGFWGFLFVFIKNKNIRTVLRSNTPIYIYIFLFIVLIHALLSTELARMFYIATPIIAVWIAIIFNEITQLKQYQYLIKHS